MDHSNKLQLVKYLTSLDLYILFVDHQHGHGHGRYTLKLLKCKISDQNFWRRTQDLVTALSPKVDFPILDLTLGDLELD